MLCSYCIFLFFRAETRSFRLKRRPRLFMFFGHLTLFATDFQVDGRQVAIKKVGDVFSDLVDAKRIVREIKLLRHFDGHENIIAIADIMTIPPDTPDFKDVYIVTNLMESDMDRIIASGQPLTDQHFQYFIYQASLIRQLALDLSTSDCLLQIPVEVRVFLPLKCCSLEGITSGHVCT